MLHSHHTLKWQVTALSSSLAGREIYIEMPRKGENLSQEVINHAKSLSSVCKGHSLFKVRRYRSPGCMWPSDLLPKSAMQCKTSDVVV